MPPRFAATGFLAADFLPPEERAELEFFFAMERPLELGLLADFLPDDLPLDFEALEPVFPLPDDLPAGAEDFPLDADLDGLEPPFPFAAPFEELVEDFFAGLAADLVWPLVPEPPDFDFPEVLEEDFLAELGDFVGELDLLELPVSDLEDSSSPLLALLPPPVATPKAVPIAPPTRAPKGPPTTAPIRAPEAPPATLDGTLTPSWPD